MKIQPAEASARPRLSSPVTPSAPGRASASSAASAASAASTRPSPQGEGSFSRLLARLGREVDRGERVMGAAMGGKGSHDPGALLALQAGIYRYVEAVDLASKLVDRAANAVKTTLQGQ